jgi:hypothetical protein
MATRTVKGRVTEVVSVIGGLDPVVSTITGLSVPSHDYVELTYNGTDLIGVVYKKGGTWNTVGDTYTGGSVVGQLELVYSGGNLVQIARII